MICTLNEFVKLGRREIPEEIYPTCLERSAQDGIVFYPTYLENGGMGKFSIPATQVG